MKSINCLANIARSYGIEPADNKLRDDIVSEYTDMMNSLSFVDESVIVKDISLLPVYTIKEGYAIDLDSLKYVVESKEMTIQEAIQEIRDVNYIGDTIPMYCVLPGNINENMTLESFTNLTESLNKYEITPISVREFNEVEFVTEAGKLSEIVTKSKDKLKSLPDNRKQAVIDKCEKYNKQLKEELEKINKMSKEEQEDYVKKQAMRNTGMWLVELAGTGVPSFVLGYAVGFAGIPLAMAGAYKISMYRERKGKHNFNLDVNNYKKAIKNTIQLNNTTIANIKTLK